MRVNSMELDAFDFSITDPLHEHLALDFANTTPYHFDLSEDHLNDYADLLSWSLNVNLLTEDEVQRLLERASSQPEAAEAVLDGAVRLREAIFNIFSSLTRDEKPDAAGPGDLSRDSE